jgi:hypothetical protein
MTTSLMKLLFFLSEFTGARGALDGCIKSDEQHPLPLNDW